MKKIILITLALLGLTSLTKSQSFDPILAGKLQSKIDSMRMANNIRGISACVVYPGVGIWKGVTGTRMQVRPLHLTWNSVLEATPNCLQEYYS